MADQSSSENEQQEQKDSVVSRRAKILATLLPIIAALPVVVAFVAKKTHMEMERVQSRQEVAAAVNYPDEATLTQPVFVQPEAKKPKLTPINDAATTKPLQSLPDKVPSWDDDPKLTPVSRTEAAPPAILDPVQAVDPLAAPKLQPVPKEKLPTSLPSSIASTSASSAPKPTPSVTKQILPPRTQTSSASSTNLQPSRKPILHIVRRGDTLTAIASKFDLNARDLAMANGFPVEAQILEGQILRIPYPDEVARMNPMGTTDVSSRNLIPTAGGTDSTRRLPKLTAILPTGKSSGKMDAYSIRYIVQPSDRIESIAAAHSTNVATISARNGGISQVRAGQEIIVPVGHILVP